MQLLIDPEGNTLVSFFVFDAVRYCPMAVGNAFEALFPVGLVVLFVSSQRVGVLRQIPWPDANFHTGFMSTVVHFHLLKGPGDVKLVARGPKFRGRP